MDRNPPIGYPSTIDVDDDDFYGNKQPNEERYVKISPERMRRNDEVYQPTKEQGGFPNHFLGTDISFVGSGGAIQAKADSRFTLGGREGLSSQRNDKHSSFLFGTSKSQVSDVFHLNHDSRTDLIKSLEVERYTSRPSASSSACPRCARPAWCRPSRSKMSRSAATPRRASRKRRRRASSRRASSSSAPKCARRSMASSATARCPRATPRRSARSC